MSSSKAPSSPTWDITYTVKSPNSHVTDWHPTNWMRTPLQRLKFLSAKKQKADAIIAAARALSSEISQQCLINETDSVGREAKTHYVDTGGFESFRLQAVKREGRWEATVWPEKEDLGWPEGKVARGKTLEACLGELQGLIRGCGGLRGGMGERMAARSITC